MADGVLQSSVDLRTVSFRNSIEALGINVKKIVHVHGTGVLTMEQLRTVANSYKEGVCPQGHAICAD